MIEVEHLSKQYGSHWAVKDLSFTIEEGGIVGFLGPNGAGKSTTMNMMTGCLAASSGTVRIGGAEIFEEPEKAKRQIGYLPEIPPLYLDRTPEEYLRFVAEAKGIPTNMRKSELDRVMQVTDITGVKDRLCKNLSKGYKQRVGIAQALLGNPPIIILDEPTVGLDPRQIIEIRDLIRELGRSHTVILSSHILSEVQAVCQKILIINKGELVASDTPENLEKLFAGATLVHLSAEATEAKLRQVIAGCSDAQKLKFTVNGTDCGCEMESKSGDGRALCASLFRAFAAAGIPLLELGSTRASLEDIFIELTETDAPAAEPEKKKKSKFRKPPVKIEEEKDEEDADDEDAEEEEEDNESDL